MKEWSRDEVMLNTRLAGQVLRYHTWPVLRPQTVADHTWQVARIYVELFGVPREAVWHYIHVHDMGEMAVGDIPFPIKRDNPTLKAEADRLEEDHLKKMNVPKVLITPKEKWCVKVCDLLEMLEYGLQEMQFGNRFAEPIVKATASNVRKFCDTAPPDVTADVPKVKMKVMSTISLWSGERGHVI